MALAKHLLITMLIIGFSVQLFSQQQFVIKSENLTKADTVWVFTPTNYASNTTKKYPAIYLLHGWSGNYHQWNDIIDCQKYADEYETIIICPDGLYDSWYINSPSQNENQFEDFFVIDLIPIISANFRIQKQNIFITGLSMGGHGALYLYAHNPAYFKSAGSLSGLLKLNKWRNYYSIKRILGLDDTDDDNELLAKYSVAGNIDKIKTANMEIIVSCGTEDPFYMINIDFVNDCKKDSINILFIEDTGGHNRMYWESAIDSQFDFFHELIKK